MSNAEHLIENAICLIESGKNFDAFSQNERNQTMANQTGIALQAVWEMANYVVFTYAQSLLDA